jgi:hypothetical protein
MTTTLRDLHHTDPDRGDDLYATCGTEATGICLCEAALVRCVPVRYGPAKLMIRGMT